MNFEQRVNKAIKEMMALGYKPKAFMTMIINDETVNAVKKVINSTTPPDGFIKLWELNRLDLSMEAIIQEKEWEDLFTEEERLKAKKRLNDYDYKNRKYNKGGNMKDTTDEYERLTEALIKASNSTETEWLNLEKIVLESYSSIDGEITRSNVQQMWNQLYLKVEGTINRMKDES